MGSLTAADLDTVGGIQNWQIVGGTGSGAFALDSATGQLTVSNSSLLNYEAATSFTLLVTVSDGVNTSAVQTVTILLSDLNEPPTLQADSFQLSENTSAGVVVGALMASDPDAGDQVTYSITSGNVGAAFAVDPVTGIIIVNDPAALDFENHPVFTLTAQVTDRGALSHQQVITISLLNQNEPPTVLAGTSHIAEWSAVGTSAGFVTASDVDAGDSLTFQIVGGNTGGRFLIDFLTGEIRLADPVQFTFESQSSYTLTVQVQDQGGLTSVVQRTVQVDNVNSPPTAVDDLYSLVQFQALSTTSLDGVLKNDSDPDSPALFVTLISGPAHGILALNADGTFSYTSTGMFAGVDSFSYQLSDGLESSQVATVTLTVGMVAPGGGGSSGGDDTSDHSTEDQEHTDDGGDSAPGVTPQVTGGMLAVTYTPPARLTMSWTTPDPAGLVTVTQTTESADLLTPLISSTDDPHDHWLRKHSRVDRSPISSILSEAAKVTEMAIDTLPDLSVSILENGVMWNQLNHFRDSLQQQHQSAATMENIVVGTTTAIGGSLTVGYVIWLIRGGSLLATMMSVMPSWISFDPLPVMDQFEEQHLDEDTESLASIVTGRQTLTSAK